jgi:hypothetical protein
MNFGQRAGAGRGRTRGAAGCAEIHFGMGWGRTRGDREGAPKFISAWVVSRSGVTEINFGHRAGAGRGRTRGAAGFAEIHFGMGWGRTWGERKGAPKFISAWVVSRSGVTEMNFGQRAGAGCGRKWGAAGCAEIHFGMGWGRTRGDRNEFRSTGRRGVGAAMGERKGAPKFISAWVVSRSGVTEINFGQRAGAGQGRTRGAAGCAEIHFGMGWGEEWGDRNKFRSTGRRGAGADAGCGRVRRNSFRHGLGGTWGDREGSPKFISAWVGGGQGATEINFGLPSAGRGRLARHGRPGQGSTHLRTAIILNLHQHHTGRWRRSPHTEDASCPRPISRTRHQCAWTEMGLRQWSIDGVRGCRTCRSPAPSRSAQTRSGATV